MNATLFRDGRLVLSHDKIAQYETSKDPDEIRRLAKTYGRDITGCQGERDITSRRLSIGELHLKYLHALKDWHDGRFEDCFKAKNCSEAGRHNDIIKSLESVIDNALVMFSAEENGKEIETLAALQKAHETKIKLCEVKANIAKANGCPFVEEVTFEKLSGDAAFFQSTINYIKHLKHRLTAHYEISKPT